jgi:molecular chaperone DnaJ
MTGDPYQILGIARTATDDEVKKAYRELSRKYHPDSYVDNPLSALAEEKFKEVQEAYDRIINERQNGGYTSTTGSYTNQTYSDSGELGEVAAFINSKRFQDAVVVLSSISNRNARWYYYSSIANLGLGNNVVAVEHSKTASSMEPNNPEYRNLVNQLSFGSQQYNRRGNGYGRGGMDGGDLCCNLCIADSCCECMGGDLCSCT